MVAPRRVAQPLHETHGPVAHQPALDGLRGLAVAGVVAYHLDTNLLPGGFLGVSLFFTLSGFLITNVVLAEASRAGTVGLRRFWTRRARRLLPAAVCGIVLAVALTAAFGTSTQASRLRGDVIGSLAYVQNWHQIATSDVYGAAFRTPSMLQHFWSLAIEEQFYVIFPLAAWWLVRRRASARRWLAVVGAAIAAAVVVQWLVYDPLDTNRAYLGSDTRAPEILVGIGLAVLIGMRAPARLARVVAHRAVGAAVALGVLAALVGLWRWTSLDDAWLYHAGFVGVAALSALAIVVALAPGPAQRALSWLPLRQLGVMSYGIYLYHWPLIIVLTPERVGFGGVGLAAVRVGATLVVSTVSLVVVENPIRYRHRRRAAGDGARRRIPDVHAPRVLAGISAALVVALVWSASVVGGRANARAVDLDLATSIVTGSTTAPPRPGTAPGATVPGSSPATQPGTPSGDAPGGPANDGVAPPQRVLFMGDSLVHQSLTGIAAVFDERAGIEVRAVGDEGETLLGERDRWIAQLRSAVAEFDPDVVVLEGCCGYTARGQRTYRAPDGHAVDPDSPELYRYWAAAALEATDAAGAAGALVIWVLAPPAGMPSFYGPLDERIPTVNAIYTQISRCAPSVRLLDWATAVAPDGVYTPTLRTANGDEVQVRHTDGLHFTPVGVGVVALTSLESIQQAWSAAGGRATDIDDVGARCSVEQLVAPI